MAVAQYFVERLTAHNDVWMIFMTCLSLEQMELFGIGDYVSFTTSLALVALWLM
jgi:hypothetical protein